MPLIPGDKLDRDTIEAVLGQGGMVRVFHAHDAKLKRRGALEVLRAGAQLVASELHCPIP